MAHGKDPGLSSAYLRYSASFSRCRRVVLAFDETLEFRRGGTGRLGTDGKQALPRLRRLEDLSHQGAEPLHDRLRRASHSAVLTTP